MSDPINFANIHLPKSPNYYLVCPHSSVIPCFTHGAQVRVKTHSALLNTTISQLKTTCETVLSKQPRTKLLQVIDYHFIFVQRSFIWKFPDYIDIELFSVDAAHTTLAIYSRSKYGYYDFNVNQKRAESWLKHLKQACNPIPNLD